MWKQLTIALVATTSVINAEQYNVVLSTEDVGGDSTSSQSDKPITVHLDRTKLSPELIQKLEKSSNIVFSGLEELPEFVNQKDYAAIVKKFYKSNKKLTKGRKRKDNHTSDNESDIDTDTDSDNDTDSDSDSDSDSDDEDSKGELSKKEKLKKKLHMGRKKKHNDKKEKKEHHCDQTAGGAIPNKNGTCINTIEDEDFEYIPTPFGRDWSEDEYGDDYDNDYHEGNDDEYKDKEKEDNHDDYKDHDNYEDHSDDGEEDDYEGCPKKKEKCKNKTKTKSKNETSTTTKAIESSTSTNTPVTRTSSVAVTSVITSKSVVTSQTSNSLTKSVVTSTGTPVSSPGTTEVSASSMISSKVEVQNKVSSTVTKVHKKGTTKASKSKPTKIAKVFTKSITTPSIASILVKSNNTKGNMNETIGGFEAKANHLVAVGTPTFALSL
ncbi:hypothetical protein C6P45_005441 [Maudiozyma exigua]|uniref:Uncharacterized protein n=1 Tax=Maudiozyma exigua TaxID=34358 RepID=A0A9P7BAE5_MAUEX|nr:hypothetical protein C6P45_005441 [Kazachstania exigua]